MEGGREGTAPLVKAGIDAETLFIGLTPWTPLSCNRDPQSYCKTVMARLGMKSPCGRSWPQEDILKDISDLRGHLAPPEQYELYASLCVLICGPPRHTWELDCEGMCNSFDFYFHSVVGQVRKKAKYNNYNSNTPTLSSTSLHPSHFQCRN